MVIISVISVLLFIVPLVLLFAKWSRNYWKRKGIAQLETTNLIFGDYLPMVLRKQASKDFFLELYQRWKAAGAKYIGIYNLVSPELVVLDLGLIKNIMVKDFVYFRSHSFFHHKNDPLSMNLFSMDGDAWKERRVKLTPVFTTGKIKMMFEIVSKKASELKDVVNKLVDVNEPVEIQDIAARFTTDVIGSVAFGLDCDTLSEPDHEFREIGRISRTPSLKRILMESIFSSNFLGKIGYHRQCQEVESYFTKVVKDAINYREKNNMQRKDFLHLMMQLKNHGAVGNDDGTTNNKKGEHFVTNEDIVSEAFIFYIAGFETSSSTMTFALFELAQHPDIQEKLRKEVLKNFEKDNGNITYESLMEMEYMDKVVRETLRKYPVVFAIPRECTRNYKLPGSNVVIEKGTKILIPVIGIHWDPEFYPNPERFDPENFSAENKAKRPDMAWLPFGEGPRQCIGLRFGTMQTKMGIATLLRNFKFVLDKSMKPPYLAAPGATLYTFKDKVQLRATKI